MSDPKSHNDPLEQFFAQKAAEYEIPYREADWEKLAHRLDLRDARRAYRRRVVWIAAAALLLVSLFGYITYDNYSRINELVRIVQQEMTGDEDEGGASGMAGDADNRDEAVREGVNRDGVVRDEADRDGANRVGGEKDVNHHYADERIQDFPGTGNQDPENHAVPVGSDYAAIHDRDLRDLLDLQAGSGSAHDRIAADRHAIHELSGVQPAAIAAVMPGVPGLRDPGMGTSLMGSYPLFAARQLAGEGNRDRDRGSVWERDRDAGHEIDHDDRRFNVPDRSAFSGFSASLRASPDLSTAGAVSNFSSPGYKLGFTVQYQLGSRLAVSAGLIRSEVRYLAGVSDYDPPIDWPAGGSPDRMTGVCQILDIPLTLRADLLQFDGSRLYSAMGVTSYIMLNETYNFEYAGYDYGQIRNWSERTGTRHWLSNAVLSLGYELDVGRRWSLQAEPYISLPLREVGWGNVRLYSVGSYVSVLYRFGS